MQCTFFYSVLSLAVLAVHVQSDCTEEELNKAQIGFKDCMDEKKATLLQTDVSEEEVQDLICSGLNDLSIGCKAPVSQFAVCRGREFVDNLVAIHLNAMSEVLGPFYPNVDLTSCPVFNTPAPTVVRVQQKNDEFADPEPETEPEYEPVVGSAPQTTVPALLMVAAVLRLTL